MLKIMVDIIIVDIHTASLELLNISNINEIFVGYCF